MWEVQGKGAACVVRGTGRAVCGVWARAELAQCAASPAGSLAFEEMGVSGGGRLVQGMLVSRSSVS